MADPPLLRRLPVAALGLAAILASMGSARSAAWTQPKGRGEIIAVGRFSEGSRYFDAKGKLVPHPGYEKFDLPILIEHGLTDRVTLVTVPALQRIALAGPDIALYEGLGHTDLGLRARVWGSGANVLSLQGTARLPGARYKADPAQVGLTDPEADLRLLYGRSFTLGAWPAFLDVQVAYRMRSGEPADEMRADVTFGVRPRPRWLVLLQAFSVMSVGAAEAPFTQGQNHKVAASLVYDFAQCWSLQLGGFATLAGRDALREQGVVAGVWYRY
ncbi:MAG TPA: hypothetical protein VIL09_07940 [Microvirga sp.]|jgi:hypothetical protein